MNDERKLFYENYISEFKNFTSNVSTSAIKSLYKHYDKKILPYIKRYGKNVEILELGCGPGYTLSNLKQNGFENLKQFISNKADYSLIDCEAECLLSRLQKNNL